MMNVSSRKHIMEITLITNDKDFGELEFSDDETTQRCNTFTIER